MAAAARQETDVCAWGDADAASRESTMMFAAAVAASTTAADPAAAPDATLAFSRKSSSSTPSSTVTPRHTAAAAPTRGAAARAIASDDDNDDLGSEATTSSDATPGMSRKTARKKCKGSKIYFQAASPRDVVLVNAAESGYTIAHKLDIADVIWIEATPWAVDAVRQLTHERINFFPGMKIASSKCGFSRLIKRVAAMHPDDFPFIPRTFSLPEEHTALQKHVEQYGKHTFVVKPDGGCGGDGIYLTNDVSSIRHNESVVQEYVANPLLINGVKFDLRLYVAVTSIAPLRFYVHREGLARMAVLPYETPCKANFHKLNMHLTNYSLNKFSTDFVPNTDADDDAACSKRKASTAFRQLREEYADFDEEAMWADIDALVGRTLAAVVPQILATTGEIPGETNYLSRCFQLMGFDVLIDDNFKPHLLEINSHPSLQTDAPVDVAVKAQVVRPLVRMVAFDSYTKRRQRRGFVPPDPEELAAWEAQCAECSGFVACDAFEASRLVSRYATPVLPLMRVFINGCSAARGKYDEMTSTRFIRLMRRLGFAGPGCAFQTAELDLAFIKATARLGSLTFFAFLDLLVDVVGDRIASGTARGSEERLEMVTRLVHEGEAAAA